MGELCVLGVEGDTKIMWDVDSEKEWEAAKEQFNLLVKKGFNAFRVDKEGDKGRRLERFEESAGKIIMVQIMQGG